MGFLENNEQFENFEENTNDENINIDNSESENSNKDMFKRKNRRKNGKKTNSKKLVVSVLSVLFVIAVIIGSFCFADISGYGGNDTEIYIDISEGSSLKGIATTLKDKNIISYENIFYLYARNRALDFKAGVHVFNTAMSYGEICDSLCEIPKKDTVKVLIPEGYELRLIAKAFESSGLCTAGEFMDAAVNGHYDYDFITEKSGVRYKLEGFLFPATYEFEHGASAHDIIDKMLYTFDSFYSDEYSARAKELGMTVHEVVTLASVVEREAANVSEHKKVAGVFYNRIKTGMNLESCATVQYVLKERKPVLSIADTKIDSPYNTYKYSGLPVGPISSPSLSAIEAVLYPEEHDYYFFVAKSDGTGHAFSRTLDEHNRAVMQNQ
ncbi:MAG: endolytic transglycosylase MltG [Clostridia bacterium]|nr:endolytic transglycosylase MltG [Clostridia bacterium]